MLSETQLRQIMPNLAAAKATSFLPHLNDAMARWEINTLARTAAFVAQLAHESGEFRWMEELWGPTDAQKRYEPPAELAGKLGNTEAGDGKRFKGRGPIQVTGRSNYQRFGTLLGIDLIGMPEQAATPAVGFQIAGAFWKSNGLNELADAGDFLKITKRINGGTNGLEDRRKYHAQALAVLEGGFEPGPAPAAARGRRAAPAALEPLDRGHEVIRARAAAKSPAAAKKTRVRPS